MSVRRYSGRIKFGRAAAQRRPVRAADAAQRQMQFFMEETNKEILKGIYKERPQGKYFKKYEFGLLLVVGGGKFYSGSPALSAMAAFRAGVDMARIIAPKRAADIIASFSPALAAYPLEGDRLGEKHLAVLLQRIKAADAAAYGKAALAVGGGLGRSEETKEAAAELLSQISVPAVVDADAIYALAKRPEIAKGKKFLITPHSHEFFVLTGKEISALSQKEKMEAVREEASRLETVILLKGKPDIISDGKKVVLNRTGSPYMSVGGTGDVLAGICGALLARGLEPFAAAAAGAYISGRAGEIAAARMKDGLLATDVISAIPDAVK